MNYPTYDDPHFDRQNEENDKEAPEDAFSHYLRLADGRTVRYDVGNDPHGPLPVVWNGVEVIGASHSVAPGTEAKS